MNHLKKIEDRVISILKTNVDARSDDMMLYLLVCNSFYSNENSVGKMPFEVVMKNYKELELPHFESVRRTRAKIQSEHPELACSPECRKARKRMQHLYSNCALPGFVDSKNEEKTERNAGYLVVSQSGGGMLRQGTREGIRRTPANRGMRAHRIVKGLDISEDVCHGMCP